MAGAHTRLRVCVCVCVILNSNLGEDALSMLCTTVKETCVH